VFNSCNIKLQTNEFRLYLKVYIYIEE